VSGNAVTFTPQTPYPASTVMNMTACNLADEAGNTACQSGGTFTTAATVDHTAPTVTISPANGTTGVGLNTQVVLTFSKSINPGTITSSSLGVFNGDVSIGYGYSISRDNRTVVVNPGGAAWASGATITVALTGGIQDLSGNGLAPTSSQFTLTTALPGGAPSVIAMRPGNGATSVPANTVITLFTNAALNPSTVAGALHVADNGALVTGTVQVLSNGQAIEFTPTTAFGAGDLVQVFLGSTAQSTDGVPLNGFSGQFTVAGSPANTPAQVQAVNPFPNATNVALNTILQVVYNQALTAVTVNNSNVTLYQYSTNSYLTPTVSLVGGGQLIQIQPTANLAANTQYQVCVAGVLNVDGVPVANYCFNFTTGAATDTVAPTVVAVAPANGATNIGTNAVVSVTFSKAINPVSVTGSTIQLSAGATIETPASISFSADYKRVSITPQAPLPSSTLMTIAINGATSQAGVGVATQGTTFTTMAGPDFGAPVVIRSSVFNGQPNVPVNSVFSMQFNKAMDTGSFNPANVYVSGGIANSIVPSTVSWSTDQTTVFLVPNNALNPGEPYSLCSYYLTDLDGNAQQNFCASFSTVFVANTNPPTVAGTSPGNSAINVPTNSPVQVQFSEPIQQTSIGQVTLMAGAHAVAFTASFLNGNQFLILTPNVPLAANTAYTLTITGVKDTAGNTMTGSVAVNFTTGATFNVVAPTVVSSDPANGTYGVGLNVAPRIVFSEPIDQLTIPHGLSLFYQCNGCGGPVVAGTVTVAANLLSATFTPSATLLPNTQYQLYLCGYTDIAGNNGNCFSATFWTGTSADTGHATVTTINPANGQTGVPLNAQVMAVLSDDLDPTTISNSSIRVTPQGGSAVAGTVSLSNANTLMFVPSGALSASTVYNVAVSGFNDTEGNAVTAFASTFTTGTTSFGGGSFTLKGTSPVNGATNVSVMSPVTFTMSNLINAASVNPNTVYVYVNSNGNDVIAGTYSVSGNAVTFTPQTPYPASTVMNMTVCNLADEAGNTACQSGGTFTTAATVDHTVPTVVISPSNGTTGVGLNTQIVLTFSKSINPGTITASSLGVFNGDVSIGYSYSISRDNRTVVVNPGGAAWASGATITVALTSGIQDLSGNTLAPVSSQFTLMTALPGAAPSVIAMRPGNGATSVPANTVITLFTNAPLNASTVAGALHAADNGALVTGTVQVTSNGQAIEFTPAAALGAGDLVQVFLSSGAQSTDGVPVNGFSGQFTVAGAVTNTPSQVVAVNPFPNATNVPVNTILQVGYNQGLTAVTVNSSNVSLYQYSTNSYLTPTLSLVGGGRVIQLQPTANLAANAQYQVCVAGVLNVDGVPMANYCFNFTTGAATDTVAPTVVAVAPANGAKNIGTNAVVSVTFSKAINPVSVTGSTIQLSAGTTIETPASISFSADYKRVSITPQAPLPSSTLMTIAINGVTSQAGVGVATQSTTFTTMAGPDFAAPTVVQVSVQSNQTVGTNATFAMQFNKPMDPGSVNPAGNQYVYVYDNSAGAYVATTITFSADSTTVMLKPTANLTASHNFNMCSLYMMDLSGNAQTNFCVGFSTGTATITMGPLVVQVSPTNAMTSVPINAPLDILFNEPIDAASLAGVTLKQGASVVPTIPVVFDGDKGVRLLPTVPLAVSTSYTINVTGVLDITGNAQTAFPSQSFTTGTGINLVRPTVVSTNPTNGQTGVPVTTTVQVVFSEPMDVASFDPTNSFYLYDNATATIVPATISFSANSATATLTPTSNLTGGGVSYTMYIGWNAALYDVSGNQLGGMTIAFKTQ
jgi:hypothetical protein